MEHGVTGSFKDKPLSEWLQRHNPTESAYRQVSSVSHYGMMKTAHYCNLLVFIEAVIKLGALERTPCGYVY